MLFRNTVFTLFTLIASLYACASTDSGRYAQFSGTYTSETIEGTTFMNEKPEPRLTPDDWQRHAYLKTNIPAWAMLWINGAAEMDIVPHLSSNLSIYYSGFNYFRRDVKFRTFTVMPELRYWLNKYNDGFFIGPHFGLCWYNVAFGGDHRYQDHNRSTPAIGGGVSLGYRFALPRNPRWKFEFSIGAGIYSLDYDVFQNKYNGLIVDRKSRIFYGIDNAAFSICYTFDVNKKGSKK